MTYKKDGLRDYRCGNHDYTIESRNNTEIIFDLRIGNQSERWK